MAVLSGGFYPTDVYQNQQFSLGDFCGTRPY